MNLSYSFDHRALQVEPKLLYYNLWWFLVRFTHLDGHVEPHHSRQFGLLNSKKTLLFECDKISMLDDYDEITNNKLIKKMINDGNK